MITRRRQAVFVDWVRRFPFLTFSWVLTLIPCVLRAEENPAQVYFYHALKSKQEGRLLTAERLLQKAIDLEPQNADFHFELGNLYVERGSLVTGRMEFEQAVMIAPDHKPAHYNLGLVYRELGLEGEARDQLQRVLMLDPTNVKAQLQIGYTYQEEGFLEDARLAFERAREMDLTDPEPRRALEDLAEFEREARERSGSAMERSLFERQQLLNRQTSPASSPLWQTGQTGASRPPSSSKDALLQAGAVLLQELLSRRSQTRSENPSATRSS